MYLFLIFCFNFHFLCDYDCVLSVTHVSLVLFDLVFLDLVQPRWLTYCLDSLSVTTFLISVTSWRLLKFNRSNPVIDLRRPIQIKFHFC